MKSGVMFDTSALICLINIKDAWHKAAQDYHRYLVGKGVPLYLSTIAIAEFTVKGKIEQIPLRSFRILPFGLEEAVTAGKIDFKRAPREGEISRTSLKDDVKLIAQAHYQGIPLILTSDENTLSKYCTQLRSENEISVQAILLKAGFDGSWFEENRQKVMTYEPQAPE